MSERSRPAVLISPVQIEQRIFLIRGHKVMIDRDLAAFYGVETKYLNRQVRRNRERFPEEFMFRLSRQEKTELVTNWHRLEPLKHSSVLPLVFTENGVAMLASVLRSKRAVRISIFIVKTFIRLRKWIAENKDLAWKLDRLEGKVKQHDAEIRTLFETIRQLITPSERPKRQSGFHNS